MKRFQFLLFFLLLLTTSCFQKSSEDDLRTTPVTNNPNIVPDRGPAIPGFSHPR